jgi:dTDP-4-dehydrorhamnose 3,5-epimerase
MKIITVTALPLPEVKVLRFARFPDERGYFTESFRREQVGEALGTGEFEIVQVNESRSRAGVFRGLHAQWNPWQGKLVRPLSGGLIDLAADIRKGSPNYGRVVAHALSAHPDSPAEEWIWLPPGFAHGVLFTDEGTIQYLCTAAWSPGCELSIAPDAPDLDWSLCDPDLRERVQAFLADDFTANEKDRQGFTPTAWAADPRSGEFMHAPGAPFDITRNA